MVSAQLHVIAMCFIFMVYPAHLEVFTFFSGGGIVGVLGVDLLLCCANDALST